jgi:hypothetical protein
MKKFAAVLPPLEIILDITNDNARPCMDYYAEALFTERKYITHTLDVF